MPFVRYDGEIYTLETLKKNLENQRKYYETGLRIKAEVEAKGDIPGVEAHERECARKLENIAWLQQIIAEEEQAMKIILTDHAIKGYHDETGEDCGYMPTSPNWYGYRAGKALRERGVSAPKKATMGRGCTVNIWTASTRFCVIFDKDDAGRVERIGE